MPLPAQLQLAVDNARNEMLVDSHKSLLPKYKVPIYQSLEGEVAARFDQALSLITAKKVLPYWEEEVKNDNLAPRIMKVAETLFQGLVTRQDVAEEAGFFYHASGSPYYEETLNGKAACVLSAAYTAFCVCMGAKPFECLSPTQIQQGFPDEMVNGNWADVASSAVLAYSGPAYDDDALPVGVMFIGDHVPSLIENYRSTFYKGFEPAKRQEFWEWWLDEAIPQAWKLASKFEPAS